MDLTLQLAALGLVIGALGECIPHFAEHRNLKRILRYGGLAAGAMGVLYGFPKIEALTNLAGIVVATEVVRITVALYVINPTYLEPPLGATD